MPTSSEQNYRFSSYYLGPVTVLGIAIVSLIYFADILIRASQKCFWIDELYTIYLSRMPTLKDIYTAAHPADFNTPLFYILTRTARGFFGEGLIATRIPAMTGVWLFCLCLFLFVSRRMGPWSGFVAGVLPFFTLVRYYAYEARAYGWVLGWCGLVLVCWQRAKEGRRRGLWLTAFGLSMAGALQTHVYAVYLLFPFAAVEFYELLRRRRPDWSVLAATFLPFAVAVPVYLPLYHSYRLSAPRILFQASHDAIEHFFINVMGSAGFIILLAVALIVLCWEQPANRAPSCGVSRQEMVLAAAFAALPLVGWLGAFLSHGPFIDRYFLSSVAGYAILLAWAVSRPGIRPQAVRVLSATIFVLMILDLAMAVHEHIKHNFVLFEPSSGIRLVTTPAHPMTPYSALATANPGLDILVCPPLEYIYFTYYAPPHVASHLYYSALPSSDDYFTSSFAGLQRGGYLNLKMADAKSFMAAHSHFLLYEAKSGYNSIPISSFLKVGYKLKSAQTDAGGALYEFER